MISLDKYHSSWDVGTTGITSWDGCYLSPLNRLRIDIPFNQKRRRTEPTSPSCQSYQAKYSYCQGSGLYLLFRTPPFFSIGNREQICRLQAMPFGFLMYNHNCPAREYRQGSTTLMQIVQLLLLHWRSFKMSGCIYCILKMKRWDKVLDSNN